MRPEKKIELQKKEIDRLKKEKNKLQDKINSLELQILINEENSRSVEEQMRMLIAEFNVYKDNLQKSKEMFDKARQGYQHFYRELKSEHNNKMKEFDHLLKKIGKSIPDKTNKVSIPDDIDEDMRKYIPRKLSDDFMDYLLEIENEVGIKKSLIDDFKKEGDE